MNSGLSAQSSLGAARAWLTEEINNRGALCPCCHQFAKIYRRRVHHTIARALIDLHRLGDEDDDYWVHVPSRISPACEIGKARYWDLVEENRDPRRDGGRAGWWRLTDAGYLFVRGVLTIPRYALIYDGRLLDHDGPQVDIANALGTKFNYTDLMNGVVP